MASGSINVSFSSIESGTSKTSSLAESLDTCSSKLNSAWNSLDSRVRSKLGSNFDTSKIDAMKKRLEDISAFLGIVLVTYQADDINLSGTLTIDQLAAIYPDFANLSDERKAIVLSALRYLGMNGYQVMQYGRNFSSEFANQQFRGDAVNHAWCAMFVGSMVSYFFGTDGGIINPSYASVWKIIGNYGNQIGIAFNPDDRVHYYVSQACLNQNRDGNGGYRFASWQKNLDRFNAQHGTHLQVSDWIQEGFVPSAGDIITFNGAHNGNYYPGSTTAYTHIGFILGTRTVNGVLYIDTVEGNVRNDVEVRSFRADDPYISGYGHIDYERFYSDQSAVQRTISEGVDVRGTGATVGLLTQRLLAFNPNTAESREAYLVSLANNIGKETSATVGATHIPATQTTDNTVVKTSAETTTSTPSVTATTTTTTTSSPTYISYSSTSTPRYSSSTPGTISYTTSPSTTSTASVSTTTESKISESTSTEETAVTPTDVKTGKSSWGDIRKDLDKYIEEYKPKPSEPSSSTSSEPIHEEAQQDPVPNVEYPTKEELAQIKETVKETVTHSKPTTVKSKPTVVEQEDTTTAIDDVKEEVIEDKPVDITPIKEEQPVKEEVPVVEPTQPEVDESYKPWAEEEEKFDYPNQFEEEPEIVVPAPVVEEPRDDDVAPKKNNSWLGVAAVAGIATGGAAIVYTVNKKKRSEEGN